MFHISSTVGTIFKGQCQDLPVAYWDNTDMPQHIVVEICKSYLPSSSIEVFYIIFPIDVYVWDKANTELATPLKYLVH